MRLPFGKPWMASNTTIGCSADQAVISVIGPISVRVSAPETVFSSPISSTFLMYARRSSNRMLAVSSQGWLAAVLCVDEVADARGIQRHPVHPYAKRAQRILDGVGHRGGHRQGASFAGAFDAQRVDRTRRRHVEHLDPRHLARGRQRIVQEAAGERLSVRIVERLLVQSIAQSVGDPTQNLTLDNKGIDDVAAIVADYVAHDLDLAAVRVDVQHAHGAAPAQARLSRPQK